MGSDATSLRWKNYSCGIHCVRGDKKEEEKLLSLLLVIFRVFFFSRSKNLQELFLFVRTTELKVNERLREREKKISWHLEM